MMLMATLFSFCCSDSPEIIEWMCKKSNKYTSPVIQNECIKLFALSVKYDSACFTIMADECTDKCNKNICIRWVGEDPQDHEDFIGLYEVDGIDANTLVHAIRDTLLYHSPSVMDSATMGLPI